MRTGTCACFMIWSNASRSVDGRRGLRAPSLTADIPTPRVPLLAEGIPTRVAPVSTVSSSKTLVRRLNLALSFVALSAAGGGLRIFDADPGKLLGAAGGLFATSVDAPFAFSVVPDDKSLNAAPLAILSIKLASNFEEAAIFSAEPPPPCRVCFGSPSSMTDPWRDADFADPPPTGGKHVFLLNRFWRLALDERRCRRGRPDAPRPEARPEVGG